MLKKKVQNTVLSSVYRFRNVDSGARLPALNHLLCGKEQVILLLWLSSTHWPTGLIIEPITPRFVVRPKWFNTAEGVKAYHIVGTQ